MLAMGALGGGGGNVMFKERQRLGLLKRGLSWG